MQDHVKIIGILWIVFGCFSLLGAALIFMILFGVSFFHGVLEDPVAPVFVDGQRTVTLKGDRIAEEFQAIVDAYVRRRFGVVAAESVVDATA